MAEKTKKDTLHLDTLKVREKIEMEEINIRYRDFSPCCGACCWFCFECTEGDGQCVNTKKGGYPMQCTRCDSKACKRYISRDTMQHYQDILEQYNKARRDNDGKFEYPDPVEVGKALDFSIKYMQIFGKL